MKILHYLFGLPPVRGGGLPKYAIDLMLEQKNAGQDVSMLVPGPIKKNKTKVDIKEWKKYDGISCYRIINPIYIPNAEGINQPKEFMPKSSVTMYLEWLKKIRPDVIHVHSLLGIHLEFFEAAKQLGIPMLYTTHDYFGLCPKIDYLRGQENCTNKDWGECIRCCVNAYRLKRLKLEQADIYRKYCESKWLMNFVHGAVVKCLRQKLRQILGKTASDGQNAKCEERQENQAACVQGMEIQKNESDLALQQEYRQLQEYYIKIFNMMDYFHFNSKQTREVYEQVLGKKRGQVIPVVNRGISDRREKKSYFGELRIGYVGTQETMKGYDYLIRELDHLYENGRTEFYLNTYLIENKYERLYIRNHKPFTAEQQAHVYGGMDVLVVPSLWRETFGMVVLEALSYGVPVLVSEYVGAKMLLEKYEGCGWEFHVQEGVLTGILQDIYDNREILAKKNNCILTQNVELDYIGHVQEIGQMYQTLKL